jgi:undecaprenyl-diphosphatase
MIEWLNHLDTALFLFLNSFHHPVADPVMVIVSAKGTWVPLYAAILVLLFHRFRHRAWIPVVAALVLFAITDLASVHLLKNTVMRLRPCHEPLLQGLVHTVNGKCGGMYGFVSSHAANTFGFATLMTLIFRKRISWIGWCLIAWAAIVSYSRIYLGVHYPADIIGGAMLGALPGWLIWRLLRRHLMPGKTSG